MSDEVARRKADAAARKAVESLSPGVLYAITKVAPNVRNGAFWGFTKMSDVRKNVQNIKSEKNMVLRKIGGDDVIVEVNPSYIVQNVASVAPDIFTQELLMEMNDSMASAQWEFVKFLMNKGISTPGFGSTIGIYCVNKVTSIVYKGVNYPAFRLSIDKVLAELNRFRYAIKVGGKFVTPQEALSCGEALLQSARMSPTKTGIFVDIKCMISPEEMKSIKSSYTSQFKGKK